MNLLSLLSYANIDSLLDFFYIGYFYEFEDL